VGGSTIWVCLRMGYPNSQLNSSSFFASERAILGYPQFLDKPNYIILYGSKPGTPVVHIQIASIAGGSSPKSMVQYGIS
jgi:hypothetical protein